MHYSLGKLHITILGGLIGEETNSLIAYLTYTSRKRHTPLHLMCLSASDTGKTWLQEKVGELIPEEDKLGITTLSNNALYSSAKMNLNTSYYSLRICMVPITFSSFKRITKQAQDQ